MAKAASGMLTDAAAVSLQCNQRFSRTMLLLNLIVPVLFVLPMMLYAQNGEEAPQRARSTKMYSPMHPDRHILFIYPSELHLSGFRKYDIDCVFAAAGVLRQLTIPASYDIADLSQTTVSQQSVPFQFTMPMDFSEMQTSFIQQLGKSALLQALRLGYQFLRETSRQATLTEFDYLELPQGTGVLRTFREAQYEALQRGEIQSLRIYEEKRAQEKKVIHKAD